MAGEDATTQDRRDGRAARTERQSETATAVSSERESGTGGTLEIKARGMQRPGERARWAYVEAVKDREVLEWVGRFRFVTIDALAQRFEVSLQRMRARIRRLEQQRLVQRAARLPNQAAVLYLTPAGARHVGSRRHRAPRPDTHRVHELALARLVCELELKLADRRDLDVLTERDARDREGDGERRYSVDVVDDRGTRAIRWPDVMIAGATRVVAIEVEFAEKGSERLRGILDAYLASAMSEVRFLVSSPTLAGRLKRLAAQQAHGMHAFAPTLCKVTIAPWSGVRPEVAEKIRARLAA